MLSGTFLKHSVLMSHLLSINIADITHHITTDAKFSSNADVVKNAKRVLSKLL